MPWGRLAGIHTYNFVGNIELIDGKIVTPLKRLLPRAIRKDPSSTGADNVE